MKNQRVITEMKNKGGSFVQKLAEAMEVADHENYQILIDAFPVIWRRYGGDDYLPPCELCQGDGGWEDTRYRDSLARGVDPQAWVPCPQCEETGKDFD